MYKWADLTVGLDFAFLVIFYSGEKCFLIFQFRYISYTSIFDMYKSTGEGSEILCSIESQ